MSLITDIFASPFKLVGFLQYTGNKGLKVKYKTDDIHDSTTKEEVYILSQKYLNDLISQYKNYTISGVQMKESSYNLYVYIKEDGDLIAKHIYSMGYDNIKDKICIENKYDDNFEIEGDFYVGITLSTYTWDDYGSDSEDDSEDDDPQPIQKTISEPECIICFESTPDMIYLECLHKCVCTACDTKGKFKKCPMCRTKIKNNKIKII